MSHRYEPASLAVSLVLAATHSGCQTRRELQKADDQEGVEVPHGPRQQIPVAVRRAGPRRTNAAATSSSCMRLGRMSTPSSREPSAMLTASAV